MNFFFTNKVINTKTFFIDKYDYIFNFKDSTIGRYHI